MNVGRGHGVLTATTYHTLASPRILQRLQQELMCAIPDATKDVELKVVENLPWLGFLLPKDVRYPLTSPRGIMIGRYRPG